MGGVGGITSVRRPALAARTGEWRATVVLPTALPGEQEDPHPQPISTRRLSRSNAFSR